MRRWYGGGWQSLKKHSSIFVSRPSRALEMSLIYIEGLLFSLFLFVLPLINLKFSGIFWLSNIVFNMVFAVISAMQEKRLDILLVPFYYPLLVYVNAYVFLEQGVKEIILKRNNLVWFHPERIKM
jgi:hypothetical protein